DLHGETREPQVDSQTFVSDTNHEENDSNDDNHRNNLDEMLHDAERNVDEKNVKKITAFVCRGRKTIVQWIKAYKVLHKCPVPMESRYKHKNLTELDSDVTKNGPPAKILWYLPIIHRLKKLYANPKDAKMLHWHAEERKKDEKIRHVADSPEWKNIDPYGNLSGYGMKGEKACHICEKNTHSQWLTNCRKTIYMGHRRSLTVKRKKLFNGTIEDRSMAKCMDGYAEFSQVADLNITFGKTVKAPPKSIWKKGLHGVKVPSGYSANNKNLVSMKDLKLLEIKLVGPVFLWYMYPFKRYMGFSKGYVRNHNRLEGSIIQGLDGVRTIGHNDVMLINDEFKQAHFTVLQNMTCKWQYMYGKYIGTRTRRLISILKKDWRKVTKEEKNFLWSDIKAHFRLENDDVKKRTLVSCGTKWKAFKTKLRVKFMLKKVSPLQKWTFIEPNEETYCCLYIPTSVLAREKVACATATVYPIGDGIVHFKKLLKGHMKGMSKTPILEVQTKRMMPQHENSPSSKKVPWNNERPLENKELNAIIGMWFIVARLDLDN
nr:transposon protein, putative, CACTA, En/Spm sub-class [Tanacetum cinerariifolium]